MTEAEMTGVERAGATSTGPVVVLVPDEPGASAAESIPGVLVVRYGPDDELPAGGAEAEVLVAADRDVAGLIRLLPMMPRLRMVQTMTAGFEQWLPHLGADVLLCNARGAHGGATAEWAAAALLSLVRELPTYTRQQAERRWAAGRGGTLMGAAVLVLGAGDLATSLRDRLVPFGADVTLVGRTPRPGVRVLAELPEILPGQDAVVVMLPLDDRTRGLVDADFLARMRDGSILVNAARGAIVDTAALLAELRAGRLRAALDVTDPEPLPAGHPVWDAPGLLLTPHVGGFAPGRADRIWRVVEGQLRAYVAGVRPANTVDR
jgi:phosphoglycerate dehydrogenase-like enzyme